MVKTTTIKISFKLRDFLIEKSTNKEQTYEDIIWLLLGEEKKEEDLK